jgi:outer membrane receptor protein involved in Fe transport
VKCTVATLVFVAVLWWACPLQAQITNATVTGRVTDPTKAVIPNVRVTLTHTTTNVTYTGITNQTGIYLVTDLPVGAYRIDVENLGFKTIIKTDIVLHVQDILEINFEMAVGSVSEQVTAQTEAPAVQLITSSISAVEDSTTVRELPLNGRSWTDLATLQPGVSAVNAQFPIALNTERGARGYGGEISIAGGRPQQNNYRLDGVSMNDYANGGPGSVLGGNLGVDAIEEFSVITSNFPAEFGKSAGGVINAVTRAGTNNFHGTAYEFLRNNVLDARNFFDGANIPPFKRNQFGASAGGPIQKDRTFVFGDYEGIRQSLGVTTIDDVPSVAARAGNLCSVPSTPPTCTPTTVSVDPSAKKYLGFYPLPTPGLPLLGNGDTGVFKFGSQQVINEDFVSTRVDHKLSVHDSLFGTYLFDRAPFQGPDPLGNILVGAFTKRQIFALQESHVFNPNFINSARFGFNRTLANNTQTVSAINPLAADPSLGAAPGLVAGQVNVGGLTQFSGGLGALPIQKFRWNSFQGYDDASIVFGRHSVKFGGAVERMQLNELNLSFINGQWAFGNLEKFLTNKPTRLVAVLPGSSQSSRGYRQTLFALYAQDDWRLRPNLILNLGLRYETTTVPTEVEGKLSNLVNITDATAHLGDPLFLNPTRRNFEPRVGFAWDPFHNGKTSVRGSFGIFDVLPLPYQILLLTQSQPFFLQGTARPLPTGSFFTGAFPLLTTSHLRQTFIEHDPGRNYVMQWNFSLQHELFPNLVGMIGYVGSHGVHQPFRTDDANIVIPKLTSAGYLWPSPVGSGTLVNPNFGDIRGVFYTSGSLYDGLLLQLTKRMSHGLQVRGAYTWSKSIDSNSATVAGDAFANSISSLSWFNLKLDRGLSDFNVGRALVINANWQVPTLKSAFRPAAWLANGWELGAIYKVNDGTPFTATWGTDGDPLGINSSDPYDFPNRLTGPGCSSLTNPGNPDHYIKTQCFAIPTAPSAAFYTANCDPAFGTFPQCFNLRGNAGRNILIGPGLSDLDFSIFKNNRISERFNVQFRAEFFNILNRANFQVPTVPTDIFDSTGAPNASAGQLTSTTTTSRQIQFAVKIIW